MMEMIVDSGNDSDGDGDGDDGDGDGDRDGDGDGADGDGDSDDSYSDGDGDDEDEDDHVVVLGNQQLAPDKTQGAGAMGCNENFALLGGPWRRESGIPYLCYISSPPTPPRFHQQW